MQEDDLGHLRGADHQALAGGLDHRKGHCLQLVDSQHASHLRQQAMQQAEVAARNADDAADTFFVGDSILGERHAGRAPMLLKQAAHFGGCQRTKLVNEAHA